MPDNPIFIPVDPRGYGCGLLLGLLIKYWKEVLISLAIIFAIFGISIVIGNITESIDDRRMLTQSAKLLIEIHETTATFQAAVSTADAIPRIQLNAGDTWSGQGLTISVIKPSLNPGCDGVLGFELIIENQTGSSEIPLIDSSAPSMVLKESSGYLYTSDYPDEIWVKEGDSTQDCYSFNISDRKDLTLDRIIQSSKSNNTTLHLAIRVTRFDSFRGIGGTIDKETQWISIQMPRIILNKNVKWIIPVSQ